MKSIDEKLDGINEQLMYISGLVLGLASRLNVVEPIKYNDLTNLIDRFNLINEEFKKDGFALRIDIDKNGKFYKGAK